MDKINLEELSNEDIIKTIVSLEGILDELRGNTNEER